LLEEETLLEGFLELHERGCNLIRGFPDRAAAMTVQALPGLKEVFVRKVYAVSPKYCASLPEPYVKATLAFLPVMKALGYLDVLLRSEDIFDKRFIEKVHPEPHHYVSL
jgi:NitT/TauT family transport system substrate-binding protein